MEDQGISLKDFIEVKFDSISKQLECTNRAIDEINQKIDLYGERIAVCETDIKASQVATDQKIKSAGLKWKLAALTGLVTTLLSITGFLITTFIIKPVQKIEQSTYKPQAPSKSPMKR